MLEFPTLIIVGTGFEIDSVPLDPGPIAATSGTLTGTLESGEPLDVSFTRDATATIVLEPATGPEIIVENLSVTNSAGTLGAGGDTWAAGAFISEADATLTSVVIDLVPFSAGEFELFL